MGGKSEKKPHKKKKKRSVGKKGGVGNQAAHPAKILQNPYINVTGLPRDRRKTTGKKSNSVGFRE